MNSYYVDVEGNLYPGDVAKSSDINHIQVHIKDALKHLLNDLHDRESYILGSGDDHKNDFIITPAKTSYGRYIDSINRFDIDKTNFININKYSVKQPFPITQTSVYSIIFKAKNDSNRDISVTCELADSFGVTLRTTNVVIPKNTVEPKEIEAIFDLDFYPTAPGLTHEMLKERDGKDIPLNTKEECYDVGYTHDEHEREIFSAGTSNLFFIIHKTNLNEIDLADNNDEDVIFDPNNSLAVYYNKTVDFAEQKIYAEIKSGVDWEIQEYNIWYEEVFSNGPTYHCTGGIAVIDGEPVRCMDSFVKIAGANAYGNVLSYVYLGNDGHLYSRNSAAANTTDLDKFEIDLEDRPPMASLIIAKVLTYASTSGNYNKEPLIIQTDDEQDDVYDTRPRSHHERIRRLEKKIKWISDIAIPSRIKYTLTNESWLDTEGEDVSALLSSGTEIKSDPDNAGKYTITTDENGQQVIMLTDAEVIPIKVTLKEKFTNKDGTKKTLLPNDLLNASVFGKITNMTHDDKEGTLELSVEKKASTAAYGRTKKEAEETKFNPWDDDSRNRIAKGTIKPIERKYTVTAGANGKHDKKSTFPAMTFYTKTNYNLTGLNIPIRKFQNCSGVKFFIWKRQATNNKKNTVWLEKKIYTSKEFSLSKAKVKGKYQYIDEGFTIKFKKGGLDLKKGQYVIIALPIPKSGKGSCFVETFKPQNSKDFCIKYEGAANASHFLLADRYQEIWYNPATFTGVEQQYYKSGSVVSNEITWEDAVVPFTYVKPVLSGNLTTPKNCTTKLSVYTGNAWQEVTPNKENKIANSTGKTFKWKLEFTGNGKATPELKYDSKDEYAIQFILTRNNIPDGSLEETQKINKNMCLTSVPFVGNKILKEYLGDHNLDTDNDSRFSGFEFARVWASNENNEDEDQNKTLLIDISASDKHNTYKTIENGTLKDLGKEYDLWTYHYCDLTLDDFSKINVDYSNYTESIEYDENNLRLKIDSEHSYNDDDIKVFEGNIFKGIDDDTQITLSNNDSIQENQTILKAVFDNPVDLTKYSSLKFKFKIPKGSQDTTISGLGLYISSSGETKTPTTNYFLDNGVEDENGNVVLPNGYRILNDTHVLPQIIEPGVSSENFYENEILEIVHLDKSGNQGFEQAYYRYVKTYDEDMGKYIYKLEQLHDIKSYNLYNLSDFVINKKENDSDKEAAIISKRIEINPDSTNLQYVKEIGIITINEDSNHGTFSVSGGNPTLELEEVVGLREDYYTIFNPEEDTGNIIISNKANNDNSTPYVTTHKNGEHTFSTATHGANNQPPTAKETNIPTTQITINTTVTGNSTQLCYFNHDYEGGLSHYKHLGIQLATDIYLPKDSLKINLCAGKDGTNVIASVNIPTLNGIYYPLSGQSDDTLKSINLSQIFSKIKSDEKIKSISITTTDNFNNFVNDILATKNGDKIEKIRTSINLYLGKITLYKAETIPVLHKKMRFKFYNIDKNGNIIHENEALNAKSIAIRKVGVIADYK